MIAKVSINIDYDPALDFWLQMKRKSKKIAKEINDDYPDSANPAEHAVEKQQEGLVAKKILEFVHPKEGKPFYRHTTIWVKPDDVVNDFAQKFNKQGDWFKDFNQYAIAEQSASIPRKNAVYKLLRNELVNLNEVKEFIPEKAKNNLNKAVEAVDNMFSVKEVLHWMGEASKKMHATGKIPEKLISKPQKTFERDDAEKVERDDPEKVKSELIGKSSGEVRKNIIASVSKVVPLSHIKKVTGIRFEENVHGES